MTADDGKGAYLQTQEPDPTPWEHWHGQRYCALSPCPEGVDPQLGDFVRPKPAGNVHILSHQVLGTLWATVCGKRWSTAVLDPASGDHGKQCEACWRAM